VKATNGRQPTNAVWDTLNRRRRDPVGCSFCAVGDEPMALQDAQAVVDEGRAVGAELQIRECPQVPDRVHVVPPPDDETEPQT